MDEWRFDEEEEEAKANCLAAQFAPSDAREIGF